MEIPPTQAFPLMLGVKNFLLRHSDMLPKEQGIQKESVGSVPRTPKVGVVCEHNYPASAHWAHNKRRRWL